MRLQNFHSKSNEKRSYDNRNSLSFQVAGVGPEPTTSGL